MTVYKETNEMQSTLSGQELKNKRCVLLPFLFTVAVNVVSKLSKNSAK